MKRFFAVASAATLMASIATPAVANPNGTWIDPGNKAKIIDWYGPFGKVCVRTVDAETKMVVRSHLYRKADGAGKDLDIMDGKRWLNSKGFHYEVFVLNISDRPIFAQDCGGISVRSKEYKPVESKNSL